MGFDLPLEIIFKVIKVLGQLFAYHQPPGAGEVFDKVIKITHCGRKYELHMELTRMNGP